MINTEQRLVQLEAILIQSFSLEKGKYYYELLIKEKRQKNWE